MAKQTYKKHINKKNNKNVQSANTEVKEEVKIEAVAQRVFSFQSSIGRFEDWEI